MSLETLYWLIILISLYKLSVAVRYLGPFRRPLGRVDLMGDLCLGFLASKATRQRLSLLPGCGRPTPVSDVFWTSTTIFNLGANQFLGYKCHQGPGQSPQRPVQNDSSWMQLRTKMARSCWKMDRSRAQFDSRIFLFTCNDAPTASADEANAARTRVQDLGLSLSLSLRCTVD